MCKLQATGLALFLIASTLGPVAGQESGAKGKPTAPVQVAQRLDRAGDPLPFGALARMGTLRLRQGRQVQCIALSADGKILASGGPEPMVRLWDAATGKRLRQISANAMGVHGLAFSPDGKNLASANADGTVSVWEVSTGKELQLLSVKGVAARAVAFSPDGKTLASASDAPRVWDLATGRELLKAADHGRWVSSVAFSPDGQMVASCGEDDTIRVWEA